MVYGNNHGSPLSSLGDVGAWRGSLRDDACGRRRRLHTFRRRSSQMILPADTAKISETASIPNAITLHLHQYHIIALAQYHHLCPFLLGQANNLVGRN